MKKKKWLWMFLVCAFSFGVMVACKKHVITTQTEEIISSEQVVAVYFQEKKGDSYVESQVGDVRKCMDFLNAALYDTEFNNGRMVKIIENPFYLRIVYADGKEVGIEIWEDRFRLDGVWYGIDKTTVGFLLEQCR